MFDQLNTDPHEHNDRAEISLHSSPVFGDGVVNGIPPCRPLIFYSIQQSHASEQKNAVERAAILGDDGEIDTDDLGFELVERALVVDSGVDHVVQSLPEAQMDLPAFERKLLH